ncbi:MAG: hypothetical protein BJ554DRAFT_3581 [Olpidium bornovanus]|uniref:Copia protein n=1 Tax=Olpidium bornovanus TaxID=278681 RepID=A0A8H7ZNI8_9FUNG|nr:MAG: hypothetical protein BJ554DRAFT_3581 [Olpidium bornovanus]
MIDNTGVAELAADVKTSRRSKHIDIKYHHLRRCVQDGMVTIERVTTADNPADLLTKPLNGPKFIKFRDIINIGSYLI